MSFENLRKTFNRINEYFFVLVIVFFFLVNQNYILYGGIFYDDWSLATGNWNLSFYERLKVHGLLFFNTRPIGALYASIITTLGKNDFLYILINSSLWLGSGIILFITFRKFISENFAVVFILIFLFPSFASTPFFSPVTQSLTGISVFFWSLSIYFSYRKQFKFVTIFYILSVLSYEISVVLFLFNILLLIDLNSFEKDKFFVYVKKGNNFFKIYSNNFINNYFQFIISKLTDNSAPLKYALKLVDNNLIIEENFFDNLKKYIFKPVTLIIIDIPKLFLKSILFIKLNFSSFFIYSFIFYFLYSLAKSKYKIKYKSNNFNILFFLFIIFSTLFVFLMYLIVTSVPQINGYYNRGLTGLFIIFALFLAYLSQLKFNSNIVNLFLKIFILFIIFLNFNSFLIQKIIMLRQFERNKIINDVNSFFKSKIRRICF